MTGGASAGQNSSQSIQKPLTWIMFTLIGVIGLIWVTMFLKDKGGSIGGWLTRASQSPTDIVEITPGQYRVRGVEPQSVNGIQNPQASVVNQPTPSSGVMEINQIEWRGVTCLNGRMRTDAKILTDNTWWEVRLDRDDKLIFQLYPRHWKPGSHLEITNNFTVMEWRVKSGQTNNFAQVAWSISPVAAN
jgi:hypothetical protein